MLLLLLLFVDTNEGKELIELAKSKKLYLGNAPDTFLGGGGQLTKQIIDKDTILIFDEFIINENWEQDEFKALNEFCSVNHISYEVIAISFITKQVAVKLIGI